MSKIICDVCGTSYPETVTQCPICGCVRSTDVRTAPAVDDEEVNASSTGTYNYVKGGRFSKSNVKKRQSNRAAEAQAEIEEDDQENENEAESKKTDRGLLVAFIVLLLSVAAVVSYILVKFLSPQLLDPNSSKKPVTGNPGKQDPVISTEDTMPLAPSCEDITIDQQTITISEKNGTFQIQVTVTPDDTEDAVVFESSDSSVATVSETGLVTAVASGNATISITCGEITKTCTVTCNIDTAEPTLPDAPQVDLPVVAAGFELNRSDFSLFKKGDTWNLYSGSIPSSEITWKSSNPKVATVSKGKVTAVSAGKAVITAEYNDSKLTCTVYCKSSVGAYVEPENSDTTQQPEQSEQKKYKLNTADRSNDITIKVGNSYTLELLDEDGKAVSASFSSSNSDICSVSGGTVTGVAEGKVNVTATYDGQSFVCIVRVK